MLERKSNQIEEKKPLDVRSLEFPFLSSLLNCPAGLYEVEDMKAPFGGLSFFLSLWVAVLIDGERE